MKMIVLSPCFAKIKRKSWTCFAYKALSTNPYQQFTILGNFVLALILTRNVCSSNYENYIEIKVVMIQNSEAAH